jgi:hypothetical protein
VRERNLGNSRQSLEESVVKFVGRCVTKRVNTGSGCPRIVAAKALILACLIAPLAAAASDATLIRAKNLRSEAAEAARHGEPLLILYSRPNCPYCDEVRKVWLLPMSRDAKHPRLKVRQVDQDSDAALIDFAGKATTHAQFAASEKVSFVPVVAVYGPSGQRLAETIVGLRLRDFYGAYLDAQLDEARLHLRPH